MDACKSLPDVNENPNKDRCYVQSLAIYMIGRSTLRFTYLVLFLTSIDTDILY